MSNHLVSTVYKRRLGSMLRKAVLALLADKASDDGRGIWASKQTIADELDCSKRAVIETMKALKDEGILRETGTHKVATGHTIEYAIIVEAVEALPLVESEKARQQRKADKGCATVTGEPDAPVNEAHGRGEPGAPKPPLNLSPSTSDDKSSSVETPAFKKEHVLAKWNSLAAGGLVKPARKLTPERNRKLEARMREHSFDDFLEVFGSLERSKFIHGDNPRGWKPTIDFILQPSSFVKLLEGAYDGR